MEHILFTASTPTLSSQSKSQGTYLCRFTSPSAAPTLWGPCLCASFMSWEGEERHSVAISALKINDGTEALQRGHRVLSAKKNIVKGAPATDHSRQGCGSESGPKSLLYAHSMEKMGKWHHPCLLAPSAATHAYLEYCSGAQCQQGS